MVQLLLSFNPLQVSYKSRPFLNSVLSGTLVSIPYRLATNLQSFRTSTMLKSVSIPYRLATNDKLCRLSLVFHQGFNPLQVSYKFKRYVLPVRVNKSFNPLQVSYKSPAAGLSGERCIGSFNPLQVSYKSKLTTIFNFIILKVQSLIGQLQIKFLPL